MDGKFEKWNNNNGKVRARDMPLAAQKKAANRLDSIMEEDEDEDDEDDEEEDEDSLYQDGPSIFHDIPQVCCVLGGGSRLELKQNHVLLLVLLGF